MEQSLCDRKPWREPLLMPYSPHSGLAASEREVEYQCANVGLPSCTISYTRLSSSLASEYASSPVNVSRHSYKVSMCVHELHNAVQEIADLLFRSYTRQSLAPPSR